MIARVVATDPRLAAAAAELPVSAARAEDPRGAVVAVSDPAAARRAAGDGAAALVIPAGPVRTRVEAEALAALPIPVAVIRPRLHGVSEGGRRAFSALAIEVSGTEPALEGALADALGVARILLGGRLTRRAASGGIALFDGPAGEAVTVRATGAAPGRAAVLRIEALGVVRVRVDVDDARRGPRVAVADAGGERIAPAPWETPERAALRRAIAGASGAVLRETADLAHDLAAARAALA